MDSIVVAAKSAESTTEIAWGNIKLLDTSLVKLPVRPEDVATVSRSGNNLIVTLKSGEQITIGDFFVVDATGAQSELVLEGDNGLLWQANYGEPFTGFTFTELSAADELLLAGAVAGTAMPGWMLAALGLVGIGAGAAAAGGGGGGGGGGDGAPAPVPPVDTTAPDAPTNLLFAPNGASLSGRAEAAATVIVRDAAGNIVGTGTVDANGNFQITFTTPQANGESLQVSVVDAAGNVSAPITVTAPDITAPGAPAALALSADGTTLTGTGEPGATVQVKNAAGVLLGSAVVAADGTFSLTLDPPQINGESLTATQTDVAGNESIATSLVAPDLTPDNTAPDAPGSLAISANGSVLTGKGEAGAIVNVTDAGGNVLASGTVDANGNFRITLNPGQTNGQSLNVTLQDASGNVSAPTAVQAPDIDAPLAPANLAVDGTGLVLSGTGEAGSTLVVRDATGAVIGSGVVNADGTFQINLNTPQNNGGLLEVVATDGVGNSSLPAILTAPDTTAPAPVSDLVIGADGLWISGVGEPGATVSIVNGTGAVVGTGVVNASGRFFIRFAVRVSSGEELTASQTDAAGNVSTALTVLAPDNIGPGTPDNLVLSGNGLSLTGTGSAGDQVRVLDAQGNVLGTGTVAPDGSFAVTLNTPQVNGEILSVIATDGSGEDSVQVLYTAADSTPPAAVNDAAVSANGTAVTGRGEPGATVTVRDAQGNVIGTGVVNAAGSFAVAISPAQADGQVLGISQTDAAGNLSPTTSVVAPDINPGVDLSEVAISADGTVVTGRGEPGDTVRVAAADGTLLATGTVASNGTFSLTLSTPQTNGQPLTVSQQDAAGNASPDASVTAPDLDPPLTPTGLALDATGTLLSGIGEAGSTVSVRDAQGNTLGTAVVGADGTFQVTLSAAQLNAQVLTINAVDGAGNSSLPVTFPAADSTPPGSVTGLQVSADGLTLTGQGEAGARVTIANAAGTVLGTATVGANGSFTVALNPAPAQGDVLNAVQVDAAGNPSLPASITTPDSDGPATPGNLAVSADGTIVTGIGSVGNTVSVYNPQGVLIGTGTVGATGSFSVAVSPAQTNGQVLDVIATDAAGESSVPVEVTASDSTAPDALSNVGISGNGTVVTGSGEVGATVRVLDTAGNVIATTVVGSNGAFAVTLPSPQINAQLLQVVQVDAAGNSSLATNVTAPDLTPPAAATELVVSNDGLTLTGRGEANATVTVLGQDGVSLGTAVVGANGVFSVTLGNAQTNGQLLSVVQRDGAGNPSPPASVSAGDIDVPGAPSNVQINTAGNAVTGSGEAGATVRVLAADGTELGSAVVQSDGRFQVAIPAQTNGQLLEVVQTDGVNISPATPVTAFDSTAPGPLATAVLSSGGLIVTGTGGEVGATVVVRDVNGAELGRGVVGTAGTFSFTLGSAQLNGETLRVNQLDAANNGSPSITLVASDITPPGAPINLTFDATGTSLSGTTEANATVRIVNAAGTQIGTGVAAPDGSFTITGLPAQLNGETLRVYATDGAGNLSAPGTAIAADTTPPVAVTNLAISPDGLTLTGKGEVGATVNATDANGTSLGSATVDANGNFLIGLNRVTTAADVVTVVETDVAGNPSQPAAINGPDGTGPVAPSGLTISLNGAELAGIATLGATVTVTNAQGQTVGSGVVDAQGNFLVLLTPAQHNGELLTVVASANNQTSIPAQITAFDTTVPNPLTGLVLSANGAVLTGGGEVGATVTVRDNTGAAVGSAVVGADGTFTVNFAAAQNNAQLLTSTQADGAGNVSAGVTLTAPDLVAPAAPVNLSLNAIGTVLSGQGEAGARVEIRDAQGVLAGTGVVDNSGNFQITLTLPQTSGSALQVTLLDAANNVSTPGLLTSVDTTAPGLVTALVINGTGTLLTGKGEVGATVNAVNAAGIVVGTATVAANGTFSLTLSPAQANGQLLDVLQIDGAGNVSLPSLIPAPDVTAPLGLTNVQISANGTTVTGVGEAGATVRIFDTLGNPLGSALVATNGLFSVTLTTPQTNLQLLTLNQIDGGLNVSPSLTINAPDLQAPGAPTNLTLTPQGAALTGRAEPGTTVTVIVSDAQGNVLGTATVAANGTFQVNLSTPQSNGQTLLVTSTDAAGNVSSSTVIVANDTTAPNPVTDLVVSPNGLVLAGKGEAGATVTVTGTGGAVLGTATVGAAGTFTVTLNPAAGEGAVLTVTQADVATNVSLPATVIAPDTNGPDQPVGLTLSADGLQLSGQADVGNVITVRDLANNILGTATVDPQGNFTVALNSPQLNGQTLLAVANDGAGLLSVPGQITVPDVTAPADLTNLAVSADGALLTGRGEAGAVVTVTAADNTVLGTATVGVTGAFIVQLNVPQLNGQVLGVVQVDGGNNASNPGSVIAGDRTAPAAPTSLVLSADGAVLTGVGEANAAVTVTSQGTVVGTGVVLLNGNFQISLSSPQLNGQALGVTLTDAAGNVSLPGSIIAVDSTPPAALTDLVISVDGALITGKGEAGATVLISNAANQPLGSVVVSPTGSFSFVLATPLTNGELLNLVQRDGGNNDSPISIITAPDSSPPAPLTGVAINLNTGAVVTGLGEPGALVTVKNAAGVELGSVRVSGNGEFIVSLNPPQLDSQVLTVVQADPPGNISLPTLVTAPDLTPPALATGLALDATGTVLTGLGEPGAAVSVRVGTTVIGTGTVDANGNFQVQFLPAAGPQLDGQQLLVTLTDGNTNVSGAAIFTALDTTPPAAPTIVSLDVSGTILVGTGQAGLRLNVSNAQGLSLGTGTVNADGTYSIQLTTPQINGETVRLVQLDATGNVSLPATVIAGDSQAPGALITVSVSTDGLFVNGTGEPNAFIDIKAADGSVIGVRVQADANGNFQVPLGLTPFLNGQVLVATQTDVAGNVSLPVNVVAPDTTAPALVTATVRADGAVVSGLGEAGATVVVTGPAGELGRGVVAADGSFSIALSPAQTNFEPLLVVQTDVAGNPSVGLALTAPDLTLPDVPVALSLTAGGTLLNGTGEIGSTVRVTSAVGIELGSAVVDANGNFSVALSAPQVNGERLELFADDLRGNVSVTVPYLAADVTPPVAVTDLVVGVTGLTLNGLGQAGATVTVSLNGTTIGSVAVDANGLFQVPLTVQLLGSEVLQITQSDPGGTSPTATLIVPLGTPPAAPTVQVTAGGLGLEGVTVGGATVTVSTVQGAPVGTVVANPDGTYNFQFATPQLNGQVFQVTATVGPLVSVPALAVAPDTTAPGILTEVAINNIGTLVTGKGEVGANVTISAANAVVGTGVVGSNGNFTIVLTVPQNNGGTLTAVQADVTGNVSGTVPLVAPDIIAPAAPVVTALTNGLILSGTGEANANVTVYNAQNVVIGTGVVDANGIFSVTFNAGVAPQLNGQALSVRLSDGAGNVSAVTPYVALDVTAPAALTNVVLGTGGTVVTGQGEVGARVTVTTGTVASGIVTLGTAVVDGQGNFTVNLATPQINGQLLSVVQTDAANLPSPVFGLIAQDLQAPGAPTGLVLTGGTLLVGAGEPGATVNVYGGPLNALLGTTTVSSLGAFSVVLSSPQANGGALSVTLTDAAGNVSAAGRLGVADTTAPVAPTAILVNASGTAVTGRGEAGATVTVRTGTTSLGTAVVAADGTFTVNLSTAQINTQVLSVTQADAAGNVSPAATGIAPDLTAPVAATALAVTADGATVTGTGEAGATVTIRGADGTVLYTGLVGGGGTFSVPLSVAQINGELLSVTLTDPRGNVSLPATVNAPDIDVNAPVVANDNLVQATVNIVPVTTVSTGNDSFTTLLGNFGKYYTFTVAPNTSADGLLVLNINSVVGLLENALFTLEVRNAAGNWVTLANGNTPGILDLLNLSGSQVTADLGVLQAGNYRLGVASTGVSVVATVNTTLTLNTTSLTQFQGVSAGPITGNVVTNADITGGGVDQTGPDNGALLQIFKGGSYVAAGNGTTVQGLYGSLFIDARGNYTYTPNGSVGSVGKVETFQYQLVHPNGLSDTANLYVRIDSPQTVEVWNPGNLGANATLVDATNDVASAALTLVGATTTSTTALGNFNAPAIGTNSGTYTFTVAPNTVTTLGLQVTASGLTLGAPVTVELSKLVNGVLQLVGTYSGGQLLALGSNTLGVNVPGQTPGTYSVKVTAGGLLQVANFATSVVQTAVSTTNFVVSNATQAAGNLFTDTAGGGADYRGSDFTNLSVLSAGAYVHPGQTGVTIAGLHGSLLVYASGDYVYTPTLGQSGTAVGQTDVFTYQLNHPTGATDTATLTINLNNSTGVTSFARLASLDSTDDGAVHAAALGTEHHTLDGTTGNDTLDGAQGGSLTFQGHEGNDTIVIYDQSFTSVDGGSGTDTLKWSGGDADIDLSNLASRINNIEIIDLNHTSKVNLTLSLSDLLSVTDASTDKLLIQGDSHDTVHMTGATWAAAGPVQVDNGVQYNVYTAQEDPSHHLWVQSGISVV